MTRRLSAEALAHLRQWEGCVLYAYDDKDGSRPRAFIRPGMAVHGTLTIGYGHTETVQPGMRITQAEADSLFQADCAPRIAALDAMLEVPVTDAQFGALLSWLFNVGEGAARSSSLIRRLNAGEYDAVPAELAKWNKQRNRTTGQLEVVTGLVNRRAAEAGLWARGTFVSSAAESVASPPTAPPPASDAGILAGVAGAAATAAPAVSSLSGVHWAVGIAIVAGAVALAAVWLLRRQRAA